MTQVMRRVKDKPIDKDSSAEKSENEKEYQTVPTVGKNRLPLRILSRIVVITSLLIIVYFTSDDNKIKPFAVQNEELVGKGQMLHCTNEYMDAVVNNGRCYIEKCKRYVTDKILTKDDTEGLLKVLRKALSVGESSDGVTTLNLHTGYLSKGDHYLNIYKRPDVLELFTNEDFKVYKRVKEKIKHALAHHFGINPLIIYPAQSGHFSAIKKSSSNTVLSKYWIPSIDFKRTEGTHFSSVIFLNDYKINFHGGRFMFVDQLVNRTVEPRTGRVVMYTSGPENYNHIERVSSGDLYILQVPFTCDKEFAAQDPR